jgi:hypothetical protein
MKKLITSVFLVFALLVMTAGTAFAQDITTITGTVQDVVIQTDTATGETTVALTLLDETTNTTQIINISLATAETLGLVTTDTTTGESTVVDGVVGTTVEVDSSTVIPGEGTTTEESQHPVGSALSNFFSDLLGVDYDTIMEYHDNGTGFGVISQALWLSNSLGGGTETFKTLLDAKKSGDYSSITLEDGSTPDNWGDVVKSAKEVGNLGSVMSGKGSDSEDSESAVKSDAKASSNSNDQGNDNSQGNDKDKTNNGNGNDKSNNGASNDPGGNANSNKGGNSGNKGGGGGKGGGNGGGKGH